MTNLEAIRQLSVEELAEVIDNNSVGGLLDKICLLRCGPGQECGNEGNCKGCIVDWLESEAVACTP